MRTLREFFLFLEEEAETFSFEELKKYVGNVQRAEYLEKTLKLIDSGSSRMVFDLGDSVLKLAMNDKGEVQNETEYNLFNSANEQVRQVLAAIQEPHDPNFVKLCMAVPHLESNGGDLGRLGQLGLTKQGHLVVLDYGFGHNAFHMYNPTPYQQHDAQQRIDMDMDNYDWDEYQNHQYDKYGNKIKQRTNTKPSVGFQKQQQNRDDDDEIPF